jgi:hypothetical protein
MEEALEPWNAIVYPALENWGQLWLDTLASSGAYVRERMPTPERPANRRGPRPEHRRRSCECDCEDDTCRCCIGKADVVIYAYPGERRIIPLVIENKNRREREVKMELCSFEASRKASIEVSGALVGDAEVSIEACGEHEFLVVVQIGSAASDLRKTKRVDVDGGCQVFYADLRVTGCDVRPVRIALAVLPYDCDQHPIDCACGCC